MRNMSQVMEFFSLGVATQLWLVMGDRTRSGWKGSPQGMHSPILRGGWKGVEEVLLVVVVVGGGRCYAKEVKLRSS